MILNYKRSLFLLLLGFTLGCAQGNCRSQGGQVKVDPDKVETEMKNSSPTEERIKIFKYDGSLQCGMGKAISLEEMAKQLKGITIFSSINKSDGLMHIQQCGTATGKANVYEVNAVNLAATKKLGFKQWTWD